MSNVIRLSAFAAAMALTGRYVAPVWTSAPTIGVLSIGSAVTVNPGSVLSVPAAVIAYSITVNGVAKTWPYTLQQADADAVVVITPAADNLGVIVPGPSCSGVVGAFVPVYPSMAIGQNTPIDASYTTLRIYNDRARASQWYVTPYGTGVVLSSGNVDATTGLPTTAFCLKVAEGALAQDPSVTGNWQIRYTAAAQRTVTFDFGGTLIDSTFSGGAGVVNFSYVASGSAIVINFDGGVTSLSVYDPSTAAAWAGGGTPDLFHAQLLASTAPFAYMRLMDLAKTNGDFHTAALSWTIDSIAWASRRTPANYFLNYQDGLEGGMPLEWMVSLLNAAGKPGWFCVPELASDDYITQYATYIAQHLSAGLTADFEIGNEHWNTGGGFYTYRKAGYAGMTEAIAFQSTTTTEWLKTYMGGCHVSTFASDGTTATVVFTGGSGHGQTVGASALVPLVKSFQTGYGGFTATGPMTVVDANTITYPCTQASTGGAIAAATVLQSSGFLALNGAAGIFTGNNIGTIFNFSYFWHYRRAFQMAKLVKDAFVAVGRQASDCRPVLAIQAGAGAEAQYTFGAKNIINFIAAQFSGAKLSDRFKAIACGGYLTLDQGSAVAGFGLTGTNKTPQDSPSVLTQLKQYADVAYGVYTYGVFLSWVRSQGLEAWGYEIGLDTIGAGGQTTTTQNACTAANGDPGIQPIITEWMQNFVALGFTRVGWYQCGAGTYAQYGCFNLGQSASEILPSTPSAGQSPKYKGLLAANTSWATPQPRHVVPCTLSGYDCVGNEAIVTVGGQWPSLSGANLPTFGTYPGPASNGETYFVWLEAQYAQTSVVTISGDYTTAGAITVSVQPCNGPNTGGGSFALTGVHTAQTLGSCTITLQPGANYVFVSASANQANVFPHSVQFA